ncbi:MAG: hypothetical protein EBU90_05300 [Proteobacteria bacterium]|nr:hypothetical protein [Pseudomonadota bacterium]
MNKQILIILTAFSFWSIQGAQRQLTSQEQQKKQEKDRQQQLKRAAKAAFKRQQKANQPNSKGQHQGCKHNRGAAGSWFK